MYNIHSHYENIFSYVKTLVKDPVLLYFHPFGTTKFENIEHWHCNGTGNSPVFLCYDQEPITEYADETFAKVRDNYGPVRNIVLLNTENNSIAKNIIKKYDFEDCYYFFHIFAAADWYRGYQYCVELVPPEKRTIRKKFITFNRITGKSRVYRSFFVAELSKNNLIEHGHVSYSDVCPEHGHYESHLSDSVINHNVSAEYVAEAKYHLRKLQYPLRIDFKTEHLIPNGSQTLNAIPEMMESFLHVVTETCFWESKEHLTEKIFKPIVARQPFVLLGCANNLKYLRRYGFKTFDSWWDESYDKIEDPIQRIQAVVSIIKNICSMSESDLEDMLQGMKYVLQHNYDLFYSKEFIDTAWEELTTNINDTIDRMAIPQRLLLTAEEI